MAQDLICPICRGGGILFHATKNGFTLHRCLACQLLFVHPIPSDLATLYDRTYFDKAQTVGEPNRFGYLDYDKDKEPMREVFVSYLKRLEPLVTGRSIFDVGAATGFFLDIARAEGWQTAGIELSDFAADKARKRGHFVLTGKLTDHNLSDQYDVVTMWDVLEHVDDPDRYMAQVAKLLKPGGYLAVNTPDASSWWARALGLRWHLLVPPEHLYYYSPRNLNLLLGRHGFKNIRYAKIGKKFSLSYFFKVGYEWQKFFLWEKLARYFNSGFWRRISIPFNLRDNIFFLAQKND